MITLTREEAQQVLDYVLSSMPDYRSSVGKRAVELQANHMRIIELLRARLAEKEQEPVAWMDPTEFGAKDAFNWRKNEIYTEPLYTAPPQREWQGLTDEEVWDMETYKMALTDQEMRWLYRFAGAIEQSLKEKNK